MEKTLNQDVLQQVAEVKLIYRSKVKASDRPRVGSSKDAGRLLISLWNKDKIDFVEEFKILLLNRDNRVLGIVDISTGGVAGTVADSKVIFVAAVKADACNIIISNNHSSGSLKPSRADEEMT